jgi:hypothetical protein
VAAAGGGCGARRRRAVPVWALIAACGVSAPPGRLPLMWGAAKGLPQRLPSGEVRVLTLLRRDRVAVLVALLGPFVVSVALVPLRDSFANTNAALILVLVIVAVATTGKRVAGVLAAVSAGVWFDFFLTRPYERLTIANQADLETTALLIAVGVGVTAGRLGASAACAGRPRCRLPGRHSDGGRSGGVRTIIG